MIGLSFLSRIKYPFLNKLNYLLVKNFFPLKKKPVFLIESKTIGIKNPKLFQLNLYSSNKEDISENYCIGNPEIIDFSLNGELKTEILDDNLLEYFIQIPQIYYFDMNLEKPVRKGKLYTEEKAKEFKENTLFDDKERFEKCIHGTIKNWCSICREQKYKEEKERQLHFKTFSIFDLIFPILQPPLGDNLDNTIVMPEGKRLYNFQVFGVKFLVENNRALLGDEMGLGKSIQAIMALRLLFRQAALRYGLIICPKSVLFDWEKKIREWAPELRVLRVHGPKEYRQLIWQAPAHIHLATYDILRIDIDDLYNKSGVNEKGQVKIYDFAVLDEIQRIKNPAAKTNRAVKKIDTTIRWGLSGTPLENKAEELISIFSYLVPGLLRYEDAYRQSYIKDKIKPFFLRRRLKDALPELPGKIQEEIWLDLTESQKEAYSRAEQKEVVQLNSLGDRITAQNIIALINELKQICNIDPVSGESCKLLYLTEKLDEVTEEDSKALVFSQFPNVTLKKIEPELKRFNPLIFDGSLSDFKREEYTERFEKSDKNKVLLMSIKAGGQGITLVRANYVFHFDHWWNPATAEQAEGRAHRIGQNKTVFVSHLYTAGTIEERIYDLLERKKGIFRNIIDGLTDTESIKKILSFEELLSLFNLKKPDRYKNNN